MAVVGYQQKKRTDTKGTKGQQRLLLRYATWYDFQL